MRKKILFIIIGILLITAIIFVIFYIKNREIPVENLMVDNKWEKKQEELKTKSEHNWEISKEGLIKCSHCNKSYEIGEQIDYKPEGSGTKILLSKDLTGYTEDQIVTREDATWVVFGITEDEKGLLITTETPLNQKDSINFRGAQAYNNGVETLNTVARELYSNSKYGYARSMTIEDVNNYLGFENPSAQYSYIETDNEELGEDRIEHEKDVTGGKWEKLDNLTTKVKDLPTFKSIISNGTYTPDGINTKEALGEYCINSYSLQTSEVVKEGKCIVRVFGTDELFEIDADKKDFIFGIYEDYRFAYSYWLASRAVGASNDFVSFGLSMIRDHSVTACVEMYDSRDQTGLYYTRFLTPGIRPVVEVYNSNKF